MNQPLGEWERLLQMLQGNGGNGIARQSQLDPDPNNLYERLTGAMRPSDMMSQLRSDAKMGAADALGLGGVTSAIGDLKDLPGNFKQQGRDMLADSMGAKDLFKKGKLSSL